MEETKMCSGQMWERFLDDSTRRGDYQEETCKETLGPGIQSFCYGGSYCGDTGGRQLIFGKGTHLSVTAIIKNPENVTYQLKDTESSKTLCLFTDFDSNNNVTLYKEDDYYKTNPTVLDMLSTGSKSNGAVAWSRTGPLDCSTISSYKLPTTPENFCNATLIEEGFETDMYLNNQNLLVTGLRVVFLKMVGFNVLMTLRLWSS